MSPGDPWLFWRREYFFPWLQVVGISSKTTGKQAHYRIVNVKSAVTQKYLDTSVSYTHAPKVTNLYTLITDMSVMILGIIILKIESILKNEILKITNNKAIIIITAYLFKYGWLKRQI